MKGKKTVKIIILVVLVLTIALGAVGHTVLSNDKYHLVALIVLNGYELLKVTDEEISYFDGRYYVTSYAFGYGIREFERRH